jgi:putative membrane protein
MRKPALLYSFAVLLLLGCSSTLSTIPGAPFTSDAEIAGIVTTANQGEVDQANVALTRASSSDVRDFAQMMVRDHSAALTSAQGVFSGQNISPADTDTSNTLRSGSQQTISALNTYTGSAFDRAYMQAQVDQHQWLLRTIDNSLIPSARSTAVRDLLLTQRGAVSSHLDRARQILQGLR